MANTVGLLPPPVRARTIRHALGAAHHARTRVPARRGGLRAAGLRRADACAAQEQQALRRDERRRLRSLARRQVAERGRGHTWRASAEPLRGCAGQPCALRTALRLELSTRIQHASTALCCDPGPPWAWASARGFSSDRKGRS
eukprot:scaffold99676_cov27-Phaeocystis_antarctica.AAC.1